MITRQRFGIVGLLLALLTLAGCNSHTDKISDLINNPSGYAGKGVTVAGQVNKVYELPLGLGGLGLPDIAAYRVTDGTGQIWVLTRAGAPPVGAKVGLKGTARPEGRIAGTTLGSVIEETGRKVQ